MSRKAIVVFLLLQLWPAVAQPDLVETVKARLNGLNSYRAEFSTELVPFPDAEPQAVTGAIEGRRPDLMRLEVALEAERVKITNEMVFDGEWQWVDVTQQSERALLRKIMKIDADIARPGAPFDTFYYYAGSGFLAGEDYLGTFEQLLNLYEFQQAGEQDGLLVLDGTLIEEKYKEYLSARDQLAISEILSVEDSMAECRLFVDPELTLPVGYNMGADASKPEVKLRLKISPNPELPASTFTYSPAEGWGVRDATAEIVQARMNAQKIEPGSDLFEAVSAFLRSDEMSEEMSNALESEDREQILALAKADPKQLSNKDIIGQTVLTKAVEFRDQELVAELLALGADVNQNGYGLNTPLHLAAGNGSEEIAKLLLERGADVGARNSSGETPLHMTRDQEMIKLLLEAGAPENVYDNHGSLPPVVSERGAFLLQAVQEGKTEDIDKYLAYGFSPDQTLQGPWGLSMTPLQAAAMSGIPQLEYLLGRWKAAGETREQTIDQLLGWAASPELVDYLVKKGADVSQVSLLEERFPSTTLALLRAGANPLEVDGDGVTPLVFCLTRRQLYPETYQLAEELIEAGDDINRKFVVEESQEELGKVALVHTDANEPERLQALLALGAEVDLATEKGWTAFHIATTFDNVDSMQLLHSKGASLTTQEENGWTPLHSAAYLCQKDALQFLLKHQKDLNIQDKAGNTALHLASHLNRSDIVRMLLEHGADPEIQNADGEKAADLTPRSE